MPTYAGMTAEDADDSLFRLFRRHLVRCRYATRLHHHLDRIFDATKIHTHTFPLDDLPTAIRYAKDRVEDAIKVVVKPRGVSAAHKVAAE